MRTCIIDGGRNIGIEKDMVFYVLRIVKEIKSPTTGKLIKTVSDTIAVV